MASNMSTSSNSLPTSTPWVALVSCDSNSTNASMDEDIFTLAHNMGAVSAILYSTFSENCIVNSNYSLRPPTSHSIDVFSMLSSSASRILDFQFNQLGASAQSITAYDSGKLNAAQEQVKKSIETGAPSTPGYLLATLHAQDVTGTTADTTQNPTPTTTLNSSTSAGVLHSHGIKSTTFNVLDVLAMSPSVVSYMAATMLLKRLV